MEEGLSQRQSCELLGFCRSRLSYRKRVNPEKEHLRERIKALSLKYPRFGYRRIHALLKREGLNECVNVVHLMWKQEKLAIKPNKKKRKRRGKGISYPIKACFPNHIWTYDFMLDQLANGKKMRVTVQVSKEGKAS